MFCSGLLTGCKSPEEQWRTETEGKTYRGTTFEIRCPESVAAITDQGEGFFVHYFRVGKSKCMMGVYEGKRPTLFSKKERNLTIMKRSNTARKNIDQGDDMWGIDSDGKLWRESLWSCQQSFRGEDDKMVPVAALLHIFYFGATPEEQEIFDSMVDTIEMR